MSDLMDEIGEDLRQQQLKALWKENGAWIIGGVIMAIVATAGMSFWREHKRETNIAATSGLLAAIKDADAAKMTDFAAKTDKDHAALAQLLAAGVYVQEGKKNEAAALYVKIEKMSGIDRIYRDLAALYGARIALDTGGDAKDLHKKLEELSDKKSAWRYSAIETHALLFAREGKFAEAVKLFDAVANDTDAPADARNRALTLRELYQAQATPSKESN